ncbi:adenylate cyclase AcyA [Aspergillus ellipticus CBS 707.79]|uniref:Adenylate cyclase n=1 Tax=Aspergillus ellipticus CBS 707.79 TaxID=1448320 RepID=A0A319CXH6_9EURO|nr:adenylate cyclase AcyA [Aspergillus ellipticus CBS 707.79]
MAYRSGDPPEGRRSSESSGANSWLSQETIREGRSHRHLQDHDLLNGRSVSPFSGSRDLNRSDSQSRKSPTIRDPDDFYSSIFSWGSSEFAPKDQRKPPQFGSHRKALNALGTDEPAPPVASSSSARLPDLNINHSDYPQADPDPLSSSSPAMAPTEGPTTFFHDYSEQEASPASTTFRPGTAQTYASEPLELDYNGDHRRPSVASAMTVSSQGSKSSAGALFRKKLQGFFGEEYPGNGDTKHDSDNQTQNSATKPSTLDHFKARERANSDGSRNNAASQDRSQNHTRAETPAPSKEITPWLYQSFNDIPQYGEAPVREALTGPTRAPIGPTVASDGHRGSKDHVRRHFSGHRHSRSKEEKPTVAGDLAGYPARPATGRDDLSLGLRPSREGSLNFPTPMTSTTTLVGRSTSPTPSVQSTYSREHGQNSPGAQTGKRSFLDKIRRPKHGHLKNIAGSKTVQDVAKASTSKLARRETSPARRGRQGSIESGISSRLVEPGDGERRKDSKSLAIGSSKLRARRGHGNDLPPGKNARYPDEANVWALDTDLSHMEGIVNPPSPSERGKQFDGASLRSEDTKHRDAVPAGNWDAPESWQVKRQRDEGSLMPPETFEPGPAIAESDGGNWFIRIFRHDTTFVTLSVGFYATVSDMVHQLSRKSFAETDDSNSQLVVQKNELSRPLDTSEMPILIQKRMLEQVGYTEKDRIDEVGREDHSYILRFTFLGGRVTGYSSLEGNEPLLNKVQQKFSHVDLSSRKLVTIPISLYKKASEIISLNLSRNLCLDVPKDFIQGCINLREIKFVGNEALRLPASFCLANRLTYLDVSNNSLEDLAHANLDRLHGLVSIKMANNRLSLLPSYFGDFQFLRSLNISSNNFQVFPELLTSISSLVDLDISFNHISELPKLGKMTSLERIWMTNNILRGSLEDAFKGLVNLKEIDARFNEITNIDSLRLLPRLEQLTVGHNAISKFKGSFHKMRHLALDHCPITQFDIDAPVPTLMHLNIASAKLVQFRDSLFDNVPNLTRLTLDKNHFVSISPNIGKLRKLEYLSIIKNPLATIPATIGCLTELKYLNLRECNLRKLPPEIWYCLKLETLNVSSNVLDSFPKHGCPQPQVPTEGTGTPAATPGVSVNPSYEELGASEEQETRRPSQGSGTVLSTGSSPNGASIRKPSVASSLGPSRKVSTASRSLTDGSPSSRKDSNFSQHVATTFAGALRNLYLADNRLEDDIFRELSLIPELRVVNLSYNELTELPQGLLRRWPLLVELYVSGNELTSLPSDDLEEGSNLKVLHINANRFQVLPAELCKVTKLTILDVGSNSLKYNVSNWPYDWNWNWNRNLKYLNFSGNKRLEIKPPGSSLSHQQQPQKDQAKLTEFTSLTSLRVLGLMDVTLTITTIPEEHEDRRVRTSASLAGSLAYGMADFLGKSEHVSIFDMIVPRLKPDKVETVVGMFDGQTQPNAGSRIAKFLHENFIHTFSAELRRMRPQEQETPLDALRRTFLTLNKNMATACYKCLDRDIGKYKEELPAVDNKKLRLTKDDIHMGGIATVMYLNNMDLYVANVGDAQAILVKSDGSMRHLTKNHDPAEAHERARIRAAGGYVSRTGKLNDTLTVSRAFGHFEMMPAVIAAPNTMHVNLTEQDEMVIVASKELWDYVTPDLVVDVTRAERRDLMVAAQKIRDLALSFGATNKLMVMILGVGDLKRREKIRLRPSLSMVGTPEEQIIPSTKRTKKTREAPGDSRLARFEFVDAPVGELAIIFTDIKKSTSLWETCPEAMRSAIQIHNDILRRQLGIIGGYEVKTEGDAFMVAFSTTTAALLWCFNCQTQLLEAEWPTEILEQPQCQVQYDMENNVIFRGLSVRMGSHWGEPVCEKDPVTNRMDYFGPMVNRASRISAVADGGQIFVSSDFMSDIQRNLEVFADSERAASTGSEESYALDALGYNIRRELQQLNSQGFVIKDQGERKLKGLENPEPLYLIYSHSLSGRLTTLAKDTANELAPTTISKHSQLEIQTDLIWRLWEITLRLERLCAALEYPGEARLKEPNVALFNVVKNHGGELADSTVVSLVEQQVTRIELCISSLSIRHMMRPFRPGDQLSDHAIPIADVMQQLQNQLAEFRTLKEQIDVSAGTATSYTLKEQIDVSAGTVTSYTGTDPQYSNGESGSDSASSSDEFNPGGPRP